MKPGHGFVLTIIAPTVGCVVVLALGAWHLGSFKALRGFLTGRDLVIELPGPDLGKQRIGDVVELKVTVRNLTRTPLQLVGAEADCSCIAISGVPAEVAAFSSASVPFSVTVEGEGRVAHTIRIYTDRPSARATFATIEYTANRI